MFICWRDSLTGENAPTNRYKVHGTRCGSVYPAQCAGALPTTNFLLLNHGALSIRMDSLLCVGSDERCDEKGQNTSAEMLFPRPQDPWAPFILPLLRICCVCPAASMQLLRRSMSATCRTLIRRRDPHPTPSIPLIPLDAHRLQAPSFYGNPVLPINGPALSPLNPYLHTPPNTISMSYND